MKRAERENWISNLEDISTQVDTETVKFVCGKYGARSIYTLRPCDIQEVWNELFQYAVDSKDN